jgi:hypothetical protein
VVLPGEISASAKLIQAPGVLLGWIISLTVESSNVVKGKASFLFRIIIVRNPEAPEITSFRFGESKAFSYMHRDMVFHAED